MQTLKLLYGAAIVFCLLTGMSAAQSNQSQAQRAPIAGGVRAPTGTLAPLTAGECTALGGKVEASNVCGSKRVCKRGGGVLTPAHEVCINK